MGKPARPGTGEARQAVFFPTPELARVGVNINPWLLLVLWFLFFVLFSHGCIRGEGCFPACR